MKTDSTRGYSCRLRNGLPARHLRVVGCLAFLLGGLVQGVGAAPGERQLEAHLRALDPEGVRLAVEDLHQTYPQAYPAGVVERAVRFQQQHPAMVKAARGKDADAAARAATWAEGFERFRRKALLGNPLLDFDRLLYVRREAKSPNLGLPQNWQGNCALPRDGYDDALMAMSMRGGARAPVEILRPKPGRMIADVDLHWDADRMLISMLDGRKRWQIWELDADGSNLQQVTPGTEGDVDNYDACYLPDGAILFDSSRCFQGVPCVGGNTQVANLYRMNRDGTGLRRLCFEQDHDWSPTVMSNGRVLYTRWEYTDAAHYFSRLLMEMNPDGTDQVAFYGSNSYWPNSMFYAREVPGDSGRVVAVVSGHHGVARMGELVLFDPALGRHEADGVVQRIPGRGQPVEPLIRDQLVNASWPRFLHPYPLSDKYFLVSCQPTKRDLWGLYLVDIFDNVVKLREEPGYALMEPVPLKTQPRPPVIVDRVRPERDDAEIFIANIYHGPGLAGVPEGSVKGLRVFSYHYAYQKIGGHREIGVEGPWEPKRVLGTVPVETDGSALFTVPANTPISIQPLDEHGQALQLMRSWMTAMPGETLSCIGCHESKNESPPSRPVLAASRPPSLLTPWYGPPRGFSFVREVQPVLDRHCVRCHDGRPEAGPDFADARRGTGNFTRSYLALHPYVRRPGPESDYHMFRPGEYRADTSELVQTLRKGHYGVTLPPEDWDRLITWIDLNVPDHGNWTERAGEGRVVAQQQRRDAMRKQDTGTPDESEVLPPPPPRVAVTPTEPVVTPRPPAPVPRIAHWPFDVEEAVRRQGDDAERIVDLGDGVSMAFVRIPAGAFVMGDADGPDDTRPPSPVRIERAFWMSRYEVSNEQYARFDPSHDSRYIDQQHKDHTHPGYPANGPRQPVVRISQRRAQGFCEWLSERARAACNLPTEAQWEYACRAGSAEPFYWGDGTGDFASFANLADRRLTRFAVRGVNPQPIDNPGPLDSFIPRRDGIDDGQMISAPVGQYAPNPWGLYDMCGNVWEWTRSPYRPYPFTEASAADATTRVVVRGGSWRDRPHRATAAYRLDYAAWQPVFNVGFRVVIEADENRVAHR